MNEVCSDSGLKCSEPIRNQYVEKYRVEIETLDLGFVVRVGCKSFAITTREEMLTKISEYFNDPLGKQNKFHETGTI